MLTDTNLETLIMYKAKGTLVMIGQEVRVWNESETRSCRWCANLVPKIWYTVTYRSLISYYKPVLRPA